MFIGHYAPAFVAATMPRAPHLGTLFIAAQLVDLVFFTFVLLGVEDMRIVPGITAMNAMDLYHMPYTHSLLGSLAFGAIFGAAIWAVTRNMRGGIIGFAVVISHWLLDLLVHIPDLTIAGSPPKLGFGLWNYPLAEIILEAGITIAAFLYYLRQTNPQDGAKSSPLILLATLLFIVQGYSWLAPQPTVMNIAVPISGLLAYLVFIGAAYRVRRVPIMTAAH